MIVAVVLAITVRFATLARASRRSPSARGRPGRAGRAVLAVATAVAAGYLVFLFCWGFNYRRLPVEARLAFDPARVTAARVVALAEEATAQVNALHGPAHARPWPDLDALPRTFGPALGQVARDLRLGWQPVPGRPKPTLLGPYFRWAGIAGMTNPFGLDVLPSPATLPFERHAVMAHEWAHLAGFAHEAEAGFVGWLTCLDGDEQARYSGWLDVWSSLVAALPPEAGSRIMKSLAEGPRRDLQAMAARNARVVPVVHDAAWRGYDAYLRAQHVPEGVASYQGVVRLLAGADRPERTTPKPAGEFR